MSRKGKRPIVCKGDKVKRASKKRGCSYGRDRKTSRCLSKKVFQARMRSASRRMSTNRTAAKFVRKLKSYKQPRQLIEELD